MSGLRDFLHDRLWANHKKDPRTPVLRLGEAQFAEKGWLTAWVKGFMKQIANEPPEFYWPKDGSGR